MKNLKSILALCILHIAFCIISNAQIQHNNIRVIDTVYTPAGYPGGALNGKLWLPSATNGAAVMLMHGWGGASPDDMHLWGDILSSYGYVVLSIDYYGMFNDFEVACIYPDPVRAVKTATEFLRKNSLQFGCYSNKVASISISGGSVHCAQTLIWDNDDSYFGTDPTINDHLDASVLFYGEYDYYNHLENPFFGITTCCDTNADDMSAYFSADLSLRSTKGNPFTNINNITTPLLMFHGMADQLINVAQSEEFRDSLKAHGKAVTLYEFPGGNHVYEFHAAHNGFPHFSFNSWSDDGIISRDTTIAWLARTLQLNNIHCPYNKSYWKNHVADWSADLFPMKLGTANSYNKSQVLSILTASAGNDPSLKLAQELIAAKLNLANNSVALPILSSIISSDNLIGSRVIPIMPLIASNSSQGNQMIVSGNTLNSYNNGTLTPNCSNSGSRLSQNNSSTNFSLSVYPNPLIGSTTISFSLSESQKVSLKIYDLNGRLMKTLAEGTMAEGIHDLTWNVDELNASIYLLQFQSTEFSKMEKLIVTK